VSDVEICDRAALHRFAWPEGTTAERVFLTALMDAGVEAHVANVQTTPVLVRLGNMVFPTTVNDREYENSYVCSPYTATISYPLRELDIVNFRSRTLRWSLRALIGCMAPLLRGARINKVVCVNNWLLSTNLYPDWDGAGLDRLTEVLRRRFPACAILFRSLNEATNAALCRSFRRAGYRLVPSRQVYVFDGRRPMYLRKPDNQRDLRLLRNAPYTLIQNEALTNADDVAAVRLYEMLYLEKYSPYNPQFTVPLVRLWRRQRLMDLFALRSRQGTLHGVVGCFSRGGVMTSPLVGYDTSLPREAGLYRMLAAIVLREAAARAMTLNLSSGVGHFKRLRGGIPYIEYTAVYDRHLPHHRRAAWRALEYLLTEVGIRVLQKYQL
jgi:hypothetical protein